MGGVEVDMELWGSCPCTRDRTLGVLSFLPPSAELSVAHEGYTLAPRSAHGGLQAGRCQTYFINEATDT